EPADGRGVALRERGQPRLGVVLDEHVRPRVPPPTPHPHADAWCRAQVRHVPRVPALLRDDPAGVALEVHPDDVAPPLAGRAPARLDEHIARDEAGPPRPLPGRVQHLPLHPAAPLPPARAPLPPHRRHPPLTPVYQPRWLTRTSPPPIREYRR